MRAINHYPGFSCLVFEKMRADNSELLAAIWIFANMKKPLFHEKTKMKKYINLVIFGVLAGKKEMIQRKDTFTPKSLTD